MQLSMDAHMEARLELGYTETIDDHRTRTVAPALAHKRAGDPGYLTLVPGCGLCQAQILSQAELWLAVKDWKEAQAALAAGTQFGCGHEFLISSLKSDTGMRFNLTAKTVITGSFGDN